MGEVQALLKALTNALDPQRAEPLTRKEQEQLKNACAQVRRIARRDAADVLAVWRGDRVQCDDRIIDAAADDALKALGFAEGLVPELADTGAEYVSEDRGIVPPRCVSADDVARETVQNVGVLLATAGL